MGGFRQNLEFTTSRSQSGILFTSDDLGPAPHLCVKDSRGDRKETHPRKYPTKQEHPSLSSLDYEEVPRVRRVVPARTVTLDRPRHPVGTPLRASSCPPSGARLQSRLSTLHSISKQAWQRAAGGGGGGGTRCCFVERLTSLTLGGKGICAQVPIRTTNSEPLTPAPLGGPYIGTASCHPGERLFHQEGTPYGVFPTS